MLATCSRDDCQSDGEACLNNMLHDSTANTHTVGQMQLKRQAAVEFIQDKIIFLFASSHIRSDLW